MKMKLFWVGWYFVSILLLSSNFMINNKDFEAKKEKVAFLGTVQGVR